MTVSILDKVDIYQEIEEKEKKLIVELSNHYTICVEKEAVITRYCKVLLYNTSRREEWPTVIGRDKIVLFK